MDLWEERELYYNNLQMSGRDIEDEDDDFQGEWYEHQVEAWDRLLDW